MATSPSALTKSTIRQKIWENIYDRLKDNVSSVSITGSVTVTIQTWTGAFPEKVATAKGSYPILVVNSPEIAWEDFTLTRKWANGTFTVDIYTTQSEAADKFLDAIIESIETYRDDMSDVFVGNINLESTSDDQATRGAFTVHLRSCTFAFRYAFTKT